MGWTYLLLAVVLEVAWASTLRWTDGFSRLVPSLVNLALIAANIVVLSRAIKLMPTALAYSVWTGLGAVGVAFVAYFMEGEAFDTAKVSCIALIAVGVIGLKLFSSG